ncbi:g7966 [Coccomyxa elongata]
MDGSMSVLVKRVKYIVSKELKVPGVLTVTETQMCWAPHNPTQCQPIYADIKSIPDSLQRAKGKPLLKVPVPNRALVFEFESEVDRDQAVDVITPILKEAQRKGKAPVAEAERPPSGLQGPQAALKQKLLQEDRDLQQLYNQLVSGGILSEAEFWKGRQNLLKEALRGSKDARQQAGFKTAMISEQTGEGGSRRVTLSLTPEIVQQLFAEKPHLHRAYTAMVPEKLSEKEFWERYFNYEVARKAKRQGKGTGDEPEDPYKEFKDEELDFREAQKRLQFVDATVNLAADYFDRDARPSEAEAPDARSMIRDINKHAAVVLEGVPTPGLGADGGPAKRPPTSGEHSSGRLVLDDLRKPWSAGFAELRIQDPKRCYESAADAATKSAATGHRRTHADALHATQALCQAGIASPPLSSHAAEAALADIAALCRGAGGHQWDALQAASGPAQANLSPQMQAVLREVCLTANELLRHFWATFPLSSPTREARALRLKKALADQYDRTTAMQESSQGIERVHITQLLKPLRLALDTALAKHDREVDLKRAHDRATSGSIAIETA